MKFHLALPINDLRAQKAFYTQALSILSPTISVEKDTILIILLNDHSLVFREYPDYQLPPSPMEQVVLNNETWEGPSFHFGLVLEKKEWLMSVKTLEAMQADFIIPPDITHDPEKDEVGFLLVRDPAGYALELRYQEGLKKRDLL